MQRPLPPAELFGLDGEAFRPAPEVVEWLSGTFISADAELLNQDHEHLRDARLGVLWTTVPNSRQMLTVAGQAEKPMFQGGKWSKRRQEMQMERWFGEMPDFVITLDAGYALQCDDVSWCALVEHELYHCAQAVNEFGAPKFNQSTGLPIFGIRGHDVEEFVGVVRRYGVGAAAGQARALVEAANNQPEVATARIAVACGTCGATV